MFHIHLIKQDISFSAEGGTLAEACEGAGYPLDLVCNGRGKCGKCRVEVCRNGVTESVLACETAVDCDMEVDLPDRLLRQNGRILTDGVASQSVEFRPTLRKRCLSRTELLPEHAGAYLKGCSLPVMRSFSALLADPSVEKLTLVLSGDTVLDIQPGDTTASLYGAAVDIGSTTVVLFAYDLVTGELIDTRSVTNPQTTHGGDVISRIQHTISEPDGLCELQSLIIGGINGLLSQVEKEHPGFQGELWHMVLCGNSTMQHLFLGLSPAALAVDPFVSITGDRVTCSGTESGLAMSPRGQMDFLPLLGGFVGGDTASVLLTLPEDSHRELMVDLGTNGEIGLSHDGRFLVASTACGPALEGGNIECGMRGVHGAIDHVTVTEEDVRCTVIGGKEPAGLCGSGIIDTVAGLLRREILDDTGRLLSREEYASEHPKSPLLPRFVQMGKNNNAFLLTTGEKPVYFSQKDVRQVQLAKSAVCAGCLAMLSRLGWTAEDVKRLDLAGAFGNYMDIDNALFIGLLPPVPRERVVSLGNGAGQGVQMCLRNREALERAGKMGALCEHWELASDPVFVEEYVENMAFA